jgi:hypothetical protein
MLEDLFPDFCYLHRDIVLGNTITDLTSKVQVKARRLREYDEQATSFS